MKPRQIIFLAAAVLLAGTVALTAFGQTAAPYAPSSSGSVQRLIGLADKEINRRLTVLNNLSGRVQAMKKISASNKTSITSMFQNQISSLTSLKAKIDADTNLPTLRTDIQSIGNSYRIYALVVPQTAVMAAADRILTMVGNANTLGTKLQARISQAQTAGQNVSSLQSLLSDFDAKVSDAQSQAQAAVDEVSSLVPDNGNQAKFTANRRALADARTKIRNASGDLQKARQDAGVIAKALASMPVTNNSVASVTTLLQPGGRVDWLQTGSQKIAYDKDNGNGFYDVYVMDAGGGNQRCLTCGRAGAPAGQKGNPAWHPSGQYVVFEGEKSSRPFGQVSDHLALPGLGFGVDLWVTDANGQNYWKVVETDAQVGGALHPHFSHDGNKLFWSERVSNQGKHGGWALKIGDFSVVNGTPQVMNIQTYQPLGADAFYESHGFSPDDATIIFCGVKGPGQPFGGLDIYTLNLRTGTLLNLTNTPKEWDEHADFSPDGKTIIWGSSQDIPQQRDSNGEIVESAVKLDWWIMNADGSNKHRITFFNDPTSPQYLGGVTTSDNSWGPDGKTFVGYVITQQKAQVGNIVLVKTKQ